MLPERYSVHYVRMVGQPHGGDQPTVYYRVVVTTAAPRGFPASPQFAVKAWHRARGH
jgi:hypothetical protein